MYTLWLLALALGIATAQSDLAALLSTQPDLSILSDLIHLTGLNANLSSSSNITILAPTNSAFEELLKLDIPEAEGVKQRDVATVGALLRNHVLRGYYPSERIAEVPKFVQSFVSPEESNEQQPFTAITGGQYNGLVKDGAGGVKILSGELSVSDVLTADIPLGPSIIIHTIASVLMFGPPLQLFLPRGNLTSFAAALAAAGNLSLPLGIDDNPAVEAAGITDLTVFIPSNEAFANIGSSVLELLRNESALQEVLRYHVLTKKIVFSTELGDEEEFETSLGGGTNLTTTRTEDGRLFVNEAEVVFANIILSNGVAHIIDSVLNPSAPFSPSQLNTSAPAADRIQFPNASPVSPDPLATVSIPFGEQAVVETPKVLEGLPLFETRAGSVVVTVTETKTKTVVETRSKTRYNKGFGTATRVHRGAATTSC